MKLFEYLFYFCGAIILCFTICLIVLNWNQEIRTKVFSSVLIGTITIFTIVYWGLKETSVSDSFRTSVAVNNNTYLPVTKIKTSESKILDRQFKFSELSKPKIKFNGEAIDIFESPNNSEEATKFIGELLQYLLLKEIQRSQEKGIQMTRITEGGVYSLEEGIDRPYPPTEAKKIGLKDIGVDTSSIIFYKSPIEKIDWEHQFFIVPVGTKIIFKNISASEKTGLEKHQILIKKERYFGITITITSLGYSDKTTFKELELTPELQSKTSVYTYLITLDAKFDKFTSGNWKTDEYKNWVKWTFDYFKSNFADESMN